ncbi:hypothetical protein LA354_07320 [Ralstonia pickettii]|uniref:hypothetical protein n=1 Tax=Ralstonia TaxID=48736 RepID=UPI00118618A7|nr:MULTISPECIES: hypothetical protein [Ralstonia]MBU6522436.1 hypothetical protein [Ralstonia sp. B265]UCA15794.1 hypothetical protein LA354_07320 [Ralstonia pickettii]
MTSTNMAEPTMIGLSEKSHALLKRLKDDGHFAEMADAYRFGIALALAHGVVPPEPPSPRTTIFSVATIDPEREIGNAVRMLADTQDMPIYRWIERLAEWGVNELARRAEGGEIDFGALLAEAAESDQG